MPELNMFFRLINLFSLVIPLLCWVSLSWPSAVFAAEESTDAGEREKAGVVYIAESDLPRNLAITLPMAAEGVERDENMGRLIRGVLTNYMAGKGFSIIAGDAVDRCSVELADRHAADEESMSGILDCLKDSGKEADGVLASVVHELAGVNIGFVENYRLDAELQLFNRRKLLGSWRDTSSRRRLSVATDPLGAVLTLMASAVTAKGGVHRRDMVYDWAFSITSQIPGFSKGSKLPKIVRVVSNVTDRPFKIGDQVMVGIEGDRGMNASFDLGESRTGIPLAETQPGIYQGAYVVKEGDSASHAQIVVHMAAPDGGRRDWPEMDSLAILDGVPPALPTGLTANAITDEVVLSWSSTDPDVTSFVVRRSKEPMQGYEELGRASRFEWRDENVVGGETYYYRIAAEDRAGNFSKPVMSTGVTIPLTGEPQLAGDLQGTLAAGRYRLQNEAVVQAGRTLKLAQGVTILAGPEGRLRVLGKLEGKGVTFQFASEVADDQSADAGVSGSSEEMPEEESGSLQTDSAPEAIGIWPGIQVKAGGEIRLDEAVFRQCQTCLHVQGGRAELVNSVFRKGETGILVDTPYNVSVEGCKLQEFEHGAVLLDGTLSMRQTTLTANRTGLDVKGGQITLFQANLFNNSELNLATSVPVALEANYLGGLRPDRLQIEGPVTLRSLLDAPWPGGQEHKIDPEAQAEKAVKEKQAGLEAFNNRQYGQAYEHLKTALAYQEDRETRLYLAYVLNSLGEAGELEELLRVAMEKYPYEVRFFNMTIRRAIAAGEQEEAKALLERALRLNPGNPMLEGLQLMVGE